MVEILCIFGYPLYFHATKYQSIPVPCPILSVEDRYSCSTKACSRPMVSSHCVETSLRYSCSGVSDSGFSVNWFSRPTRVDSTMPALSRTLRCLVIPCRLNFMPALRLAIELFFPPPSRATNCSLVLSPSAANSSAGAGVGELGLAFNMGCNSLSLTFPAFRILAHGLRSFFVVWEHREAGLDDRESGPSLYRL